MKEYSWDIVAALGIIALVVVYGIDNCHGPPDWRSQDRRGALACHAAGGRWVSVTLDKDGDTKLWACVDDAGRHVRLTEMK